jgi:hypothetical protein
MLSAGKRTAIKGKCDRNEVGKHTLEMNLVKVITSHELNVHDFPDASCIGSPVNGETPMAETKERCTRG